MRDPTDPTKDPPYGDPSYWAGLVCWYGHSAYVRTSALGRCMWMMITIVLSSYYSFRIHLDSPACTRRRDTLGYVVVLLYNIRCCCCWGYVVYMLYMMVWYGQVPVVGLRDRAAIIRARLHSIIIYKNYRYYFYSFSALSTAAGTIYSGVIIISDI